MKPHKTSLNCAILTLVYLASIQSATAATPTEYDYPELMVTPLASERLNSLSNGESKPQWLIHWPMFLAGAANVVGGAAYTSKNPPSSTTSDPMQGIAIGIGAGSLVAGVILANYYHPYTNGFDSIKDLPVKTKRDQLARERMAEESIEHTASVAKRIMWISFIANTGAGAALAAGASLPGYGIASIAASLTQLVFQYPWIENAANQREYKKKIYAPIASATVFQDQATHQIIPGMNLAFHF